MLTKAFKLRWFSDFQMQEQRQGSPLYALVSWSKERQKPDLVLQQWTRLNSPHHRNWFFLMPLWLAVAFLKENPRTANILNTFFHLYSWMFNETVRVKIQVKCRMYYSSGSSLETWTNDLSLISRFLLLLMGTVDGPEMLLQLHISDYACFAVWDKPEWRKHLTWLLIKHLLWVRGE